MQNLSSENAEFYLHESKNHQWLRTEPHFETEAWDNSEMAYLSPKSIPTMQFEATLTQSTYVHT